MIVTVRAPVLIRHFALDENDITPPLGDQSDAAQKILRRRARSSRHLNLLESRAPLDAEGSGCSLDLDQTGTVRVDHGVSGRGVAARPLCVRGRAEKEWCSRESGAANVSVHRLTPARVWRIRQLPSPYGLKGAWFQSGTLNSRSAQ